MLVSRAMPRAAWIMRRRGALPADTLILTPADVDEGNRMRLGSTGPAVIRPQIGSRAIHGDAGTAGQLILEGSIEDELPGMRQPSHADPIIAGHVRAGQVERGQLHEVVDDGDPARFMVESSFARWRCIETSRDLNREACAWLESSSPEWRDSLARISRSAARSRMFRRRHRQPADRRPRQYRAPAGPPVRVHPARRHQLHRRAGGR